METPRQCAVDWILCIIGDRWSLRLVSALLAAPRRTTDLVSALAPISTRTLAERLKRLEAAGILTRTAYPEAPPRVEYALTERGRALAPVLSALKETAAVWEGSECSQANGCGMCDGLGGTEPDPQTRKRPSFDVTLL